MKKTICLLLLFNLFKLTASACDGCQKQQPFITRSISHGSSPDSQWDYLIVSIAAAVVVFTLFYSIKWLVKPGERSLNHIKNQVLTLQ